MKRLYLHNLGCAKNQVDGEMLAGWAEDSEVLITDDAAEAEVIVVNTCAFIQEAKEEAIDAILEAAKLKSEGICQDLYVCGCFPQLYREELTVQLPEVDGFFGVEEWPSLLKKLTLNEVIPGANPHLRRRLQTPAHYAYIRIADGCERGCTYCVIPKIRGKYRSRPIDEIVSEARLLAQKGVKELLPVAQELNSYGQDLDKGKGNGLLKSLFEALVEIDDIEWIRPLYLHPPACDEELIEFWASQQKLIRYLDLPIEHASDEILRSMGRAGKKEQIRRIVNLAREYMPDVVIRTSIIIGFPGETDYDFEELLDFIKEMRFERLGSFQFSPEEYTPAASLPNQVPDEIKSERQARLMELQSEISFEYCLSRVGSIEEVFVDTFEADSGYSIAHSRKEIPELDGEILISGEYAPGSKLSVRIESATEYDLFAQPVDSLVGPSLPLKSSN